MSHQDCGSRCFAPPHPALLARTRALQLQGLADTGTVRRVATALPQQSGLIGLNDGTIFPRSHYKQEPSIKRMSTAALERAPLRNAIRIIVVVVDFQDVKVQPETIQRTQDLWFSTGGKVPTGSVTEFYSEVSNHAISLTGEVVGPFTLKEKMAYYANNDSGMGFPGPNSQTMADEAFEAAKSKVKFGQYDNDGNGYVDAFVVVHAGRDAAETGSKSDIWSVKWVLPQEREADGVKVFGFLTVPADAKCGVCAHEIGHLVFGWPDLYDTDYSSAGIGSWCLMSFGSWGGGGDRPVHPSAWCKSNQGWVETVTETSNRRITLQDVKTGFKTHRLWTNGDASGKEYFLIENRQTTGSDQYLPGSGLLVWHVDDAKDSNTDENHPKIKLMQADGLDELLKRNLGSGDAGDVYPGTMSNHTFNSLSKPDSKSYSGKGTYVSVTNIPLSSVSMTFDITVKPNDQPPAGSFDSKMWYRLKNTYQPATKCLDVVNDNDVDSTGLLQMAAIGDYSGQHWQLKPNSDGSYCLRTMFLGQNRQLDVRRDKKTPVLLPTNSMAKAQFWSIKPWGDGTWHLENAWTEGSQYLDTMEGGPKVEMNQANIGRPTQRWTIEAIRKITEAGF